MKRRVFNVLAWVSLVLFAVTAVAWATSYWRVFGFSKQAPSSSRESAIYHDEWDYWYAAIIPGQFVFTVGTYRDENPPPSFSLVEFAQPPSNPIDYDVPATADLSGFRTLGFARVKFQFLKYAAHYSWGDRLAIPLWFIALLTAKPPAFWFRRWHASQNGLCEICGYDLRATPDRCPECGEVPKKTEKVSA